MNSERTILIDLCKFDIHYDRVILTAIEELKPLAPKDWYPYIQTLAKYHVDYDTGSHECGTGSYESGGGSRVGYGVGFHLECGGGLNVAVDFGRWYEDVLLRGRTKNPRPANLTKKDEKQFRKLAKIVRERYGFIRDQKLNSFGSRPDGLTKKEYSIVACGAAVEIKTTEKNVLDVYKTYNQQCVRHLCDNGRQCACFIFTPDFLNQGAFYVVSYTFL